MAAIRGSSYNQSSGYFTPQFSGTYVFHVSSAVKYSGTFLQLSIEGGELYVDLNRTTSSHNGWDTTSRDVVYTFNKGTKICLNLWSIAASESLRQTSWSAFLLDNVMSPVIAFCAGRTSEIISAGRIDYTNNLINVGNAWDLTADIFTASQSGIYVFSVSCATQAGQIYSLFIYVNGVVTYEMTTTDTVHNGHDTVSRTFAVSLSAGSTVYTGLVNGSIFSNNAYQTSIAGFLYEPLNGRKVIWSVHQTNTMNGAYGPFPFNDVDVNIGNGWNSSTSKFVAPYAGVYQLHLTATSMPNSQVDFRLYWNNVAYANIYSTTTNYNGLVTRSRAIMIDATAGDTFFIATLSSTHLYSSSRRLISFTGFLISS